jgi:DNA-binding MarR family transcriptional regulator
MHDHGYPPRLAGNAAFLLARLGQETVRPFGRALAPVGLAPREWGLLEVLDDRGPGTQGDLAERLNLDRGDMARFVDRLAERGLIASVQEPHDRRVRRIELTADGREVLEQARPLAADAERLALPGLDEEERAELRRLLATVSAHRRAATSAPTGKAHA